ncbi:MAG: tetratricopeptide repeat protein [Gammaproteobacteria bacterium]|nr:tetratricopeptide repeat protein [Gammaproteobacteria bacterium]
MSAAFALAALLGSLLVAALVAAPLRRTAPRSWLAVVAAVPLIAAGLYQLEGTPAALDPAARAPAQPEDAATRVDPAEFAEAVAQLRAELARNPAQPEGWVLLARSLAVQGDAAGARDAYAKALEQAPDEPALMVELAQASAQSHPRHLFDDAALALLQRAAALQPMNQRARWFIGVAQRQRGLHAEAADTWESLLPDVDPSTAASLAAQIRDARAAAGQPRGATTPALVTGAGAAAGDDPEAGAAAGLRVRVRLAPGVAERIGAQATVFVMARDPDGPPMPVAAERHPASALPLDIVLDDGDSPMPTRVLSQLDSVLVSARVSVAGSAERSAGDLESRAVRVALPATDAVELVIGAE